MSRGGRRSRSGHRRGAAQVAEEEAEKATNELAEEDTNVGASQGGHRGRDSRRRGAWQGAEGVGAGAGMATGGGAAGAKGLPFSLCLCYFTTFN